MSCFLQALSSPVCIEAPDASPCFLSLSIGSGVSTLAFQTFEQHWITSVHICPPLCFAAWLLDDLLWGALRAKQPEPQSSLPALQRSWSSATSFVFWSLDERSHWKGSMFLKQTNKQKPYKPLATGWIPTSLSGHRRPSMDSPSCPGASSPAISLSNFCPKPPSRAWPLIHQGSHTLCWNYLPELASYP